MTKKYEIVLKYVRDMSVEIPNAEVYVISKEFITKYSLGINITTNSLKNEMPIYELISGATLAFAALLLIFPGFATDLVGILLVIPITRRLILGKFIKKKQYKKKETNNYIDGEYEDLGEDDDKKI